MSLENLQSFGRDDLQVAVIGASGGIGQAFVARLCAMESVGRVYAFSRAGVAFDDAKVISGVLDLTNEDSIAAAAEIAGAGSALDLVIVASGILHDDTIGMGPEKSLRDLHAQKFETLFAINTIGPALVAKHFLPKIPKDKRSVFAVLSARVGSITDNGFGGWYGYRASKAALNMVVKTTAIEIARRYKNAVIVALHPGTVDTGLSAPFQGNVQDGKLFTPDYSASCLLNVIDALTPEDSGKLVAWDGQKIPY